VPVVRIGMTAIRGGTPRSTHLLEDSDAPDGAVLVRCIDVVDGEALAPAALVPAQRDPRHAPDPHRARGRLHTRDATRRRQASLDVAIIAPFPYAADEAVAPPVTQSSAMVGRAQS
jgi:hypothetical protein